MKFCEILPELLKGKKFVDNDNDIWFVEGNKLMYQVREEKKELNISISIIDHWNKTWKFEPYMEKTYNWDWAYNELCHNGKVRRADNQGQHYYFMDGHGCIIYCSYGKMSKAVLCKQNLESNQWIDYKGNN